MDQALAGAAASLAGGIVGGSITLAGVWVKDRHDRRREALADTRRIVDDSLRTAVRALSLARKMFGLAHSPEPQAANPELSASDEQLGSVFYEIAAFETLLAARLGPFDLYVVTLTNYKDLIAKTASTIVSGEKSLDQELLVGECGERLANLAEVSRIHLLDR